MEALFEQFMGVGVNFGIFSDPNDRREYWCSSKEAESIEISISFKNLFLNRCIINMCKLK